MSYGLRLFFSRKIYDLDRKEELFLKAIIENVKYHQKHCSDYDKILKSQGFSVDLINSIDDIHKIPPLPTLFLKKHSLYSAKKSGCF